MAFNASFANAHTAADFGGEVCLAHSVGWGVGGQWEWRVPTGDLVAVYRRMGYDVSVLDINKCMSQGYLAAQGIRIAGRYLFPLFAQPAPPLVDMLYSYPYGGIHSLSHWVAYCWIYLIESGFPVNLDGLPSGCAGGFESGFRPGAGHQHGLQFQELDESGGSLLRVEEKVNSVYSIDIQSSPMTWIYASAVVWKRSIFTIPKITTTTSTSSSTPLTKLSRLLSLLSAATSEIYTTTASFLLGHHCHPMSFIRSVAKTTTFYHPQPFSNLGASISSANFSHDMFTPSDLILTSPGFTSPSAAQSGSLFILSNLSREFLGSQDGRNVQEIASIQIMGPPTPGARFGHSALVLDFNLDGIDDLAVSAPWEDDGVVYVFYGRQGVGLKGARCQGVVVEGPCVMHADRDADVVIRGGLVGSGREEEEGERLVGGFGFFLTKGDVTGDGGDDLIVGSPYAGTRIHPNRGTVHAFASKRGQGAVIGVMDALWEVSGPEEGIDFQEFGRSVVVNEGVMFVGVPGWRVSYFENVVGMVLAYRVVGSGEPEWIGSTVANVELTGFGR
ncbi:Glycosylphosphatidylinositol specific phospholipase D1 [Podochytrium sp. JEL0797]|nr:Glycosylphosphatidylinositol specific phospholipase D1 [Podochytrium sp. JEL0797]